MATQAPSRRHQWTGVVAGIVAMVLVGVLLWEHRNAAAPVDATPRVTATTDGESATRSAGRPQSPAARGGANVDQASGLPYVAESKLPAEAHDTLVAIRHGGPFRFPRNDGATYHNLNRVLPPRRDGYYREYTVVTPGASNRGTRRIIVGSNGEMYYTGNHYDTFSRILEGV